MDSASWADTYSDASQAFLLREFGRADDLVESLVKKAAGQRSNSNKDDNDEIAEVIRKVWILKVTLIASREDTGSKDPVDKESQLLDVYKRIQAFYGQNDREHQQAPIHPSILVALSLAGLKLALPGFSRRTLEDYFDVLLCCPDFEDGLQDASIMLDSSHADLSLSGMAVNSDQSRSSAIASSWTRSLHRLARIYTIHILGKAMQDWATAREWIIQQRTEDIGIQLVTEDNAESLLEELEAAKAQQEQEAIDLRQREKDRLESIEREKERRKRERDEPSAKTTFKASPSDRKSSSSTSNASSNRAKHNKNRATPSSSTPSTTHSSPAPQRLGWQRPSPSVTQDTGFAALRSHLSSFLTTDRSRDSLVPASSGSSPASRVISLDYIKLYLSRLAKSRLLNSALVLLILLGFWRRRIARTGRSVELGKTWTKIRDKVIQTIKMGGSLGYL